MSAAPLLPQAFWFRLAIPCVRLDDVPRKAPTLRLDLPETCRVPQPARLDGREPWAEVRVAWNPRGLAVELIARADLLGLFRDDKPEGSYGFQLWIDTRDTHNIHRAGRFCHQFIFMPAGAGRALDEPAAEQLLINRARENAKPVRPGTLAVRRAKRVDGYVLEGFIPAAALTGFDPIENPKLGFTYAVIDRELGEQTFSCASEFPYREDPSLWATLELLPAIDALLWMADKLQSDQGEHSRGLWSAKGEADVRG